MNTWKNACLKKFFKTPSHLIHTFSIYTTHLVSQTCKTRRKKRIHT